MESASTAQDLGNEGKLAYESPVLFNYGSLGQLTATAGGVPNDLDVVNGGSTV